MCVVVAIGTVVVVEGGVVVTVVVVVGDRIQKYILRFLIFFTRDGKHYVLQHFCFSPKLWFLPIPKGEPENIIFCNFFVFSPKRVKVKKT